MKYRILIIFLFWFSSIASTKEFEKLKFSVPEFKPFTYQENGIIQGIGVELAKKVLDQVGVEYSLEIEPNYGRVVVQTKSGKTDGFFLASKNLQRDEIAVFSDAIMINRWSWFLSADSYFSPKTERFKTSARIATHLNTNTHRWLKKNGFNVSVTPNNVAVLPDMLFKYKRADAVFLAEIVFIDVAKRKEITPDKYRQVVESEKPFGMYISKNYLSRNPGFMDKLNQAIGEVAKENAL